MHMMRAADEATPAIRNSPQKLSTPMLSEECELLSPRQLEFCSNHTFSNLAVWSPSVKCKIRIETSDTRGECFGKTWNLKKNKKRKGKKEGKMRNQHKTFCTNLDVRDLQIQNHRTCTLAEPQYIWSNILLGKASCKGFHQMQQQCHLFGSHLKIIHPIVQENHISQGLIHRISSVLKMQKWRSHFGSPRVAPFLWARLCQL